jgi:hypothetical protein
MTDRRGDDASTSTKTRYEVEPPHRAGQPPPAQPRLAEAAEPRPRAVFVVHGMGQQIPFQTLDQIAEGLLREDAKRRGVDRDDLPQTMVSAAVVGEERVPRAELTLRTATGSERKVHVYEGYWAPLTEGQVQLRDVLAFLLRGAWNGILNQREGFRRWIFHVYQLFDVPISASLMLGIAASFIVALTAMNAAVVLVTAARSPLQSPPDWLSAPLFADLTTLMNVWITLAVLFGATLLVAWWLRRRPGLLRSIADALSVGTFTTLVLGTIVVAASLPILFWGYIRCLPEDKRARLLRQVLGTPFVDLFDKYFLRSALLLLALGAAGVIVYGIARLLAPAVREIGAGGARALAYVLGMVGAAVVIASLAGEISVAYRFCGTAAEHPIVRSGISWVLLFVLSAWIRSLLVQYPGDVAAYVTPQALDRFQKLRDEIKEKVWKRARAVYAEKRDRDELPLYESCVLAGHSLGSVIAYDVLNRLILEDETGPSGDRLDVVARTPLFLTFGSPLDKTAFVFGIEGKRTTEAREALAAAVQPMISEYRFRPKRWVNIHSPWDIVSGRLDFYDLPTSKNRRRVKNYRDPLAATFLAAHVEYWKGELLYRFLYREVTR